MESISQFLNFQGCPRPSQKTSTEMRLSEGQIDERTAFFEDSKAKILVGTRTVTICSCIYTSVSHSLLEYNHRRPAEEDPTYLLYKTVL